MSAIWRASAHEFAHARSAFARLTNAAAPGSPAAVVQSPAPPERSQRRPESSKSGIAEPSCGILEGATARLSPAHAACPRKRALAWRSQPCFSHARAFSAPAHRAAAHRSTDSLIHLARPLADRCPERACANFADDSPGRAAAPRTLKGFSVTPPPLCLRLAQDLTVHDAAPYKLASTIAQQPSQEWPHQHPGKEPA